MALVKGTKKPTNTRILAPLTMAPLTILLHLLYCSTYYGFAYYGSTYYGSTYYAPPTRTSSSWRVWWPCPATSYS